MIKFRSIVILFFAVALFVGTVGIHVFEHFCSIDGVDYSFYLPPTHACSPETKKPSCCQEKPQHKFPKFEKKCCNEALTSYQLSADFTQHTVTLSSVFLPTLTISVADYFPQSEITIECALRKHIQRPPPKKGQEILILNQVFIL